MRFGIKSLRHNPNSTVYNGAYINERLGFDVLSTVLEQPSTDNILRILAHMSLTRDPRAPLHVPDVAKPLSSPMITFPVRRANIENVLDAIVAQGSLWSRNDTGDSRSFFDWNEFWSYEKTTEKVPTRQRLYSYVWRSQMMWPKHRSCSQISPGAEERVIVH
jgi:hypothetical protein